MTGGAYTWGKECSFNDKNIMNEVNKTSREECASTCETTLRCTHFVFSKSKTDLNCRLLEGRVDNKSATYMPKSECGYMDSQIDLGIDLITLNKTKIQNTYFIIYKKLFELLTLI